MKSTLTRFVSGMITIIAYAILTSATLLTLSPAAYALEKDRERVTPQERNTLQFVQNMGQIADMQGVVQQNVLFKTSVKDADLFFLKEKVIFVSREKYMEPTEASREERKKGNLEYAAQLETKYRLHRFELLINHTNPEVKVSGRSKSSNFSNFYLGHCPQGIMDVPHFNEIYYENIYPGIDLRFYSNLNGLKYDFIVKPGGDPSLISYTYDGVTNITKDAKGNLLIDTPFLDFTDDAPYSYIFKNGKATEIRSQYVIQQNTVKFKLDDYSKAETLVIDPTLNMVWSTYLDVGSSTWDNVAFNSTGDFYATCYTYSTAMNLYNPGAGAYYQGTSGGSTDLAIIKFSNAGVQLWTTFYGGSGSEYVICNTTAVDGNDHFYVGGETSSTTNFPLQNGGGYYDGTTSSTCGFLLKFDNNANRLWSTFIGASGARVRGITTTSNNDVYIVGGCYNSAALPVQDQGGGAYYQAVHAGGENGYIMRFNSSTSKLWCTYFGGNCYVNFIDIHVDPVNNNLYCVGEISGWSAPTSYPPLVNPGGGAYFDNTVNGKQDLFFARFNTNRTLTWSTVYGGQFNDNFNGDGGSIDTDASGNFYFCGKTMSNNFPTVNPGGGAYFDNVINTNGTGDMSNDGYLLKFNTSGVCVWSTFYGGSADEITTKLYIDNNNNIWTSTASSSSDIPLMAATGHYNQAYASSDAVLARFSASGVMEWATCVGGTGYEEGRAFSIYEPNSSTVELFMVGATSSTDYPTVNPGGGAHYVAVRPSSSSSYLTKLTYTTCEESTAPAGISSTSAVCSGSAVTLTTSGGTAGTGASYQWYAGGCGTGSVIGTGASISVSPTSATTYYVRRTGSCNTTSCISFNVTPATATPSSVAATAGVTLYSGDYLWCGNSSSDWSIASNWYLYNGSAFITTSTLPEASSNVYILAGASDICVWNASVSLTATGNARNVFIGTGASALLNAQTLNVHGNWTNNGTFNQGTGTVTFTGSTAQSLGGSSNAVFYNLRLNKSANALTPGKPVSVTNQLDMTAGNIATTATNILTVGTSAAATGTIAWTAGSITGPIQRYYAASSNAAGDAASIFPVGTSTHSRWAKIHFTTASSGGLLKAQFRSGSAGLFAGLPMMDNGVMIHNYSSEGYWEIAPVSGISGGIYTIKLRANNFNTVTNTATLRIIKSPDLHLAWTASGIHGSVTPAVPSSDFEISKTNMSGFSWFTIASDRANVLPVNLTSLTADCMENGTVEVKWSTASEQNSQHFIVQKSQDMLIWERTATIPAAGNSNYLIYYQSRDYDALNGLMYYRLIQTDNDGTEYTYGPVSVSCTGASNSMHVFPNPSEGDFTVQVTSAGSYPEAWIEITDITGKIVKRDPASLKEGMHHFLYSQELLQAGTYVVRIITDQGAFIPQKIVIR